MKPTDSFVGPELVLGGFRSLRYFYATGDEVGLISVNQGFVYTDSAETYTAKCNARPSEVEMLHMMIEKYIPRDGNTSIDIISRNSTATGVVYEVRFTTTPYVEAVWFDETKSNSWDGEGFTYTQPKPVVKTIRVFLDSALLDLQHEHEAPNNSCRCGFYSFYGDLSPEREEVAKKSFSVLGAPFIGVVENYGRVIHGTMGLRAQKMKILGIAPSVAPMFRKALPIPTAFRSVCFDSKEKLLLTYPTSSTVGLFDERN